MGTFYQDVTKNDPRFESMRRVAALDLLEPVMHTAISAIISDARALGIELMVFETYRSQARQQELFNQGASKLWVVGVHHYGLACDSVKVVAGEPSWFSLDNAFRCEVKCEPLTPLYRKSVFPFWANRAESCGHNV